MFTTQDTDEFWSDTGCGCGQCETHDDSYVDDDDVYDDSYDVVMYDLDVDDDDLYALIDMLTDGDKSWYAKRRLNALAASGPLSDLVAAAIIDSLGRRWDPLLHPRDRFGRFINTGGFFRWLANGEWLRGQVTRIDSDGVIHARAIGNDSVPDGTTYRFKHEQAVKLVSTKAPRADLTPPDLDADIPDFPEATDIQKRIYNHLEDGDIPAADLDRSLRGVEGIDLSVEDFTGELRGLQDRGLVEITPGDPARVRRSDNDDLGVVDINDEDIADVPDGETPDLDDSPEFTKEQRDLLDRIEALQGDNESGALIDDLEDQGYDPGDLQALIDADAVEVNEADDRFIFLENPEGDGAVTPDANAPSADISTEIFNASQDVSDDPDVQEAFQHFAEELARPGDAANMPEPEGLPAAKRRNAEAAARKWWEDKNGTAPQAAESEADAPSPKSVLNPRNQALADQSVEGFFPGEEFEEFLDSRIGEDYRRSVKQLLDAEDLEENGFDAEAATERDKGLRGLRNIEVPENEVEEWLQEVKDIRERERNGDVQETEEVVEEEEVLPEDLPEDLEPEAIEEPPLELPGDDFDVETPVAEDVPEDVPEDVVPEDIADVPEEPIAEEELPEDATDPGEQDRWAEYSDSVAAQPANTLFDRINQENDTARELGLDLRDNDAPPSWDQLSEDIGHGPAELLFNDTRGDLTTALAKDPGPYFRQFENQLLSKFERNPGNPGPEVMRLRQAGLIEADENGGWQITDAGRKRLGIDDAGVPEANVPEPEPVRELSDEERDLLTRIQNGGQARRSERTLEDALIEEGILEEDDNGDSRLTDAGFTALGEEIVEEEPDYEAPPADAVTQDSDADVTPDADVAPDAPEAVDDVPEVEDDVTDVADEDEAAEVVDDVVAEPAFPDANSAPILPDPSDPNADTPGFRWTGGQGGFNAGGFYDVLEDNGHLKAGDKVYVKNGRSPEHAQNEALANRLYALAGVDVPELVLGSTNDRLVSKIIDDLREMNPNDPNDIDVLDKVREQFAVDAWIANWDGMNPGNTLVTPDGKPYRIDVGSAMEFRAQGGLKGAAFGDTVGELESLRDPSRNYDTAKIFGPMTDDEVAASVARLADVSPDDIRSTILASDLPDKEALADKMIARRANTLAAYGVSDAAPDVDADVTPDDVTPDADVDVTPDTDAAPDADVVPDADADAAPDVDVPDADADADVDTSTPAPTPRATPPAAATIQSGKAKSAAARQRLDDFQNRSNPHLEAQYDDNGVLIMADGSTLDRTQYYHTAKGGEGKHGLVVEVLDQDRYPGLVKMEFQDGTQQVRHVLGVNSGKGGLVPSDQTTVDEWERQARVIGDTAEEVFDPADFPMSDGNPSAPGTQIVFDVGGEEMYGVLLYINPKWDNGGRAYIIPEGGGKVIEKPVRLIRGQTQSELDSDASPLVPYEYGKIVPQHLPAPRFDAAGNILSRDNQPIRMGDWLAQRSGGDGLVGEVIDIPDQNLYPGWITLRFPDGEVRARHVEGFTGVNQLRGAGGLKHATAPDPATWTRVRRVKGEEGDVLDYNFDNLETSDGTPIKVGEAVFGVGRNGQEVTGLLIRINPHMKRNGEVVPTGFVWQNGREVPVDVSKITNTLPPMAQRALTPRPPSTRVTPRPSPARTTTTRPPRAPQAQVPTPNRTTIPSGTFTTEVPTSPIVNNDNPAVGYTAGSGSELPDDVIDGLDLNPRRLYTSTRTNGVHSNLAAIYEAQDFDTLPQVVSQAEYARLARDEGYVPIVRSVDNGIDRTTGLPYHDAFKWGAYYAGDGVHGNGSYFAYGPTAFGETYGYGNRRIYALVRPGDMRTINIEKARAQQQEDYREMADRLRTMDRTSDEYKSLSKKADLYRNDVGEWAAAKGYDAIIVAGGNSFWGSTGRRDDDDMSGEGYLVVLNRGATIVADQAFPDRPNIFENGLPDGLADAAAPEVV